MGWWWRRQGGRSVSSKFPGDVDYFGRKYPREFTCLNSATFLLNGQDLADWSPEKQGWFLTDYWLVERYRFYIAAVGYLSGAPVKGDYHEYGIFGAHTFRMVLTEAKKHGLDDMTFYAFDSFAGLPEVDSEVRTESWKPGTMAMSEEEFKGLIDAHGIYLDRIRSIKGFYSDSLTPELQRELLATGRKAGLVTLDCDLYQSAVPVLRFLEPLLQEGTLLYVDDYYAGYGGSPRKGVARAVEEFTQATPWKLHPYLNVGWWGKSFICY